jgi:hypothetical protein
LVSRGHGKYLLYINIIIIIIIKIKIEEEEEEEEWLSYLTHANNNIVIYNK